MFPVTSFGKLIASLTMLSGVLVFALPITVIGTKFTNIVRDIEKVVCSNNLLVVGACFGFKLSRFGSVK
jgi:cytoskeletal protein CcmA (bactofilin family)